MSEVRSIQVFVPDILGSARGDGLVVARPCTPGDHVEAEEVLFEVRSALVDGEILAPFAGRLMRTFVDEGDLVSAGALLAEIRRMPEREPEPEPSTGRAPVTVRRAPVALSMLAAAPALLLPTLALVLASIAGLIVVGAREARLRKHPLALPAGPLWVLVGALWWVGRSTIGVIPLGIGLARVAWWAGVSVLLTWGAGALIWIVQEGSGAAVAAGRLAVYHHAYALLAFLAVRWSVARALAQGDRSASVRRSVRRLPATAPWAAAAALLLVLVACAAAPRATWFPARNLESAVGALPLRTTNWVDERRADWVSAEIEHVERCLAARNRSGWQPGLVVARPDHTLVASIYPHAGRSPGPRTFAALAIALQNELEPHDVTVVLHLRKGARLRFRTRSSARPVRDLALLDIATTPRSADTLSQAMATVRDVDIAAGLRCSAAAL